MDTGALGTAGVIAQLLVVLVLKDGQYYKYKIFLLK
jgi:hypothetical protein